MDLLQIIGERAQATPNAIALEFESHSVSYADLVARAGTITAALRKRGLLAGDRILFVAENSIEFVAFALGVWGAQGVVATAYATSGAAELSYIVRNAGPRLVLISKTSESNVQSALLDANLSAEVLLLDSADAAGHFSSRPETLPSAAPSPIASGYLCYTSGSTAHPKAVMHSQAGVVSAVLTYRDTWHVTSTDTLLVAIPLAWAYGLLTSVMVGLTAGARLKVAARFKPEDVVRAMQGGQVTVLLAVTTHFVKTLDQARTLGLSHFAPGLRLCVSGGEPRNETAFEAWHQATGCAVHDVYAATEAFPAVTYDPTIDPTPIRGSAGRVVKGCTFRVINEHGAPAPVGEAGEGQWRSPATMLGYWGEPNATSGAITEDGFYHSGDRVRIDERGYVFVEGRYSDVILRGGANVSPLEIETVLREHPSVEACVVCGLPDPESGQMVAAAVVVASGHKLDATALKSHCAKRLARYKQPSFIVALDSLPMTATGKTKRKDVVQILQGMREEFENTTPASTRK